MADWYDKPDGASSDHDNEDIKALNYKVEIINRLLGCSWRSANQDSPLRTISLSVNYVGSIVDGHLRAPVIRTLTPTSKQTCYLLTFASGTLNLYADYVDAYVQDDGSCFKSWDMTDWTLAFPVDLCKHSPKPRRGILRWYL
jgi:hypothetical protein